MRPSLIRRVAFVSFRLATRAVHARTGGIRRTHPVNDKRAATRLLRPRRADGDACAVVDIRAPPGCLRPLQACLLAPERARGQAGPPRAYLVQSWAASASIAKAGAVGLRVHSWASLAVR
ncbi:hypothetical protein EV121DRAFT_256259 [Schizophyllum commune]